MTFPTVVTTIEVANLILNCKQCDTANPKFSGSKEGKYEPILRGGGRIVYGRHHLPLNIPPTGIFFGSLGPPDAIASP